MLYWRLLRAARPRERLTRAGLALTLAGAVALMLASLALAGCGTQQAGTASRGRLQVVAAENFWGSIAAQLGGEKVHVHSIIVNPGTDPHEYEPTPADARSIAASKLTIVNGIGYDEWALRLLSAEAQPPQKVLNVGSLLHLSAGANPHQWYSPASVHVVIDAITAAYQRLRPNQAGWFAARRRSFETRGLARYQSLIAEIRRRYSGVPVGYSESIFQPLGLALHLKLLTPYGFAKAVAEGTEVTARQRAVVDAQARQRKIAVWVFNSQNVTPDVKRVNEIARAAHIPIVTVTETLSPASDSFQQWQASQLERLAAALGKATGR